MWLICLSTNYTALYCMNNIKTLHASNLLKILLNISTFLRKEHRLDLKALL